MPNNGSYKKKKKKKKKKAILKMFSFHLIVIIEFLICIIISTNEVNSLLPVFATNTNTVRPVWFSSKHYTTTEKPLSLSLPRKIGIPKIKEQMQRENNDDNNTYKDDINNVHESFVIFIHGRLEAEFGKDPFARPAELYSDFCYGLANRAAGLLGNSVGGGNDNITTAEADTTTTTSTPSLLRVLLIEYDELLSKKLKKEPRDFRYGPISSALAETIQREILNQLDADIVDRKQQQKLILVTFSMGAAMAMKLLYNSNKLQKAVTHVIFIEPVFRCWLPFAVMHPQNIIKDSSATIEVLALYGTNDQLTRDDSGKSVLGSLRQFIPNINVIPIQGGNHWGVLTEKIAGPIARDGLDDDQDFDTANNRMITPQTLQSEMIDHIAAFCGWD